MITATLIPRGDDPRCQQLVVLAGADAGRVFALSEQTTIGRAPNATITLSDGDVSRIHVKLFFEQGAWWAEDTGSRNGMYVNGTRCQRIALRVGDKLRIGQTVVVQLVDSDPIEAELIERQRFEAVGRLGLGIAHDFNNMLAAMMATVDYLSTTPFAKLEESDLNECLGDMRSATKRATLLAAKLLHAGKRPGAEMREVDVSKLCGEVVQLIRRTFPRRIVVENEIASNQVVMGDPVSLHQVLMNLVVNARDAMPGGGRISLSVRSVEDRRHAGRQIVIAVQDTGVGMSDTTVRRIFDPFFTTKAEGVGFGLGLATVKELVLRHGGNIDVRSRPGKGTTFWVTLPARVRDRRVVTQATVDQTSQNFARAPGAARILLADDESVLRRGYRRILRQSGYTVDEAANGREALDRFNACPPQLVLLDVDMPLLDGLETCKAIRALDANMPVVFVTGHDDADLRRALLDAGAAAVLIKPVSADELIMTVGVALSVAMQNEEAMIATLA